MKSSQKGSITILVVMSLAVLFGFSALAIDLGYIQMKKSDLRNAADAGALAGASGLVSYGEDLDELRTKVLGIARKNLTPTDSPELAVTDADIEFLRDGVPDNYQPNQIRVTVRRATDRGNPINLFFGPVMDVDTAQVEAVSTAGIFSTCASKCLLPVIVPTKFTWNDYVEDTKSKAYNNGMLDVTSPLEMATVNVQGYTDDDAGTRITLKIGDPHETIASSQYNAIDLPPVNKGTPVTGASAYSQNWTSCTGSNSAVVETGDEMQLEPGNMVGPTRQGVLELIAQDPGASWDTATNRITGSAYSDPMMSPRVGIIAFYDPGLPPVSGRTTLRVYQLGAIFVESVSGQSEVSGRFIRAMAKSSQATSEENCLIYMARLVD